MPSGKIPSIGVHVRTALRISLGYHQESICRYLQNKDTTRVALCKYLVKESFPARVRNSVLVAENYIWQLIKIT